MNHNRIYESSFVIFVLLSTDTWRRTTRKPLPMNEGVFTNFEVQFARIISENPATEALANSKKYVVYDVTCKQDTQSLHDPNPVTIERRYTDFLKLFEALKKTYPQFMMNLDFPKKKIMGNFTNELISQRALAFENFLDYILGVNSLKESEAFLSFLQDEELIKACRLCDERRNEIAVPILENIFQFVNKVFMDKSKPVLLLLCRLVAACTTSPIPHPLSEKYIEIAIRRFDHVSDVELLVLYCPLLNAASYLFWQKGIDDTSIKGRLESMSKQGIKTKGILSLTQAIHTMECRSETF